LCHTIQHRAVLIIFPLYLQMTYGYLTDEYMIFHILKTSLSCHCLVFVCYHINHVWTALLPVSSQTNSQHSRRRFRIPVTHVSNIIAMTHVKYFYLSHMSYTNDIRKTLISVTQNNIIAVTYVEH